MKHLKKIGCLLLCLVLQSPFSIQIVKAQDLTSGLVAHIDFNSDNFTAASQASANGSFVPFQDKSGKGNIATCFRDVVVRGVTYSMDQCPRQSTGPDNSPAAEFYGTLCDRQSDHLGISNSSSLDHLTTGTMALWVLYHQNNINGTVDTYRNTRLLDTFKNGTAGTWYLGRDGTTNNLFKANTISGLEQRLFLFPDLNLYSGQYETWNHLAVTWDGSRIRGYFNGTNFIEVSQANFPSFNLGTYITIGALNHSDIRNSWDGNCVNQYGGIPGETYVQPNTGFMNGKMDDIRIYNRSLSTSEIAALATAPLKRATFQLQVQKSGSGRGYVSSSTRGIGCGAGCAEAFPPGTKITLSASAWTDSEFAGWTGPCSGQSTCTVTMNSNIQVGAVFNSTMQTVAQFEAEAGTIQAPLVVRDGMVLLPGVNTGTPTTGGTAEYEFQLATASEVLVLARVNTPNSGSDSFFVNFDTLPTSPDMVWDMGSSVGIEDRLVSWRGTGTSDTPQFEPKWFTLAAGPHKLIVVGRESGTQLDSIRILKKFGSEKRPLAPQSLRINP